MRPWRLAYVVTHPIQYQAPMLRYLAACPELDLTVLYLSDCSLRSYQDPGFGRQVAWDVPLLGGYRHEFLPSVGRGDHLGPLTPFPLGLAERLRPGRFDAVWVHGYAHPGLLHAIFVARSHRLPVLLRGESWLAGHQRSGATVAAKSLIMPALFRHIDAFLCVGSRNRAYYRHYGVSTQRLFDMPYAVDNAFFQARCAAAGEEAEAIRARCGAVSGRPLLLYCSKFIARKNPEVLWEAYRRLSPDGRSEPAPILVFVGDGPERRRVESAVATTGWTSVHFAGFQNQSALPAWYRACDCFVLPSQHEPWGLVVNEAMNAGRAVIATTDAGASADLIEDGVTGALVPPGDAEGLAEALRSLTASPERLAGMGRAALQRMSTWGFAEDRAGLFDALAAVVPRGDP